MCSEEALWVQVYIFQCRFLYNQVDLRIVGFYYFDYQKIIKYSFHNHFEVLINTCNLKVYPDLGGFED